MWESCGRFADSLIDMGDRCANWYCRPLASPIVTAMIPR
jgi:hypothetical protein